MLYIEGWVKVTAEKIDSLKLLAGDYERKSNVVQDSTTKLISVTTDNDYNEGFL